MKIDKLRVRPKKAVMPAPCAAEFAQMLACWASANDLGNTGPCAQSAQVLQQCMRSQVRAHRRRGGDVEPPCMVPNTLSSTILGRVEADAEISHQLSLGPFFEAGLIVIVFYFVQGGSTSSTTDAAFESHHRLLPLYTSDNISTDRGAHARTHAAITSVFVPSYNALPQPRPFFAR